MKPELLEYYDEELRYLREYGEEFKKAYPKIADRLGLEDRECADPYVERLLEGYAFLAARVRLKIDEEFPRFSQHLLDSIYPQYLAPVPSMAIVKFVPDLNEGSLVSGFSVPRNTQLLSAEEEQLASTCEFRTAHDLTLWPIELAEAVYFPTSDRVQNTTTGQWQKAAAGLRLRLRTLENLTFDKLDMDTLALYLSPGGELAVRLYQCLATPENVLAVHIPAGQNRDGSSTAQVAPLGFADQQALLPQSSRSFSGYRLLQEYFTFPERYLFIELRHLLPALRRCQQREVDIIVYLKARDAQLERTVAGSSFALFCTPAINLFARRADPILLRPQSEHQVVADVTRPTHYEIHCVTEVLGYGRSANRRQVFKPLYAFSDKQVESTAGCYYTVRRVPRLLPARQYERERLRESLRTYPGSEVFIALVDVDEAPYPADLRQLAVKTLCTNRDLPLQLRGRSETRFRVVSGEPVQSVSCLAGPTKPKPSLMQGVTAWRLISHLSLNYLSLNDTGAKAPEQGSGAAALREMLRLYGDTSEAQIKKQIDGIKAIATKPVTERLPLAGPITFARGLEINLTFEESAFVGSGMFLLGAVLEQFFARYVAINSFTRTVLRSHERDEEVTRWPARLGKRSVL